MLLHSGKENDGSLVLFAAEVWLFPSKNLGDCTDKENDDISSGSAYSFSAQ